MAREFTFKHVAFAWALVLIFASHCSTFGQDLAEEQLQSYALEIHGSVIRSLDFSPDSRIVAVGIHGSYKDETGTRNSAGIAVWSLESRQLVAKSVFDSGTSPRDYWSYEPKFLHYMPDGRRLVVYEKGALKVFDTTSLKETSSIDLGLPPQSGLESAPHPWVVDMNVAPEGNKVAVLITYLPTYKSGKLRIYDVETSKIVWEWSFDEDVNGYSVSFSPNATKIAIAMPQARRGSDLIVLDINSNRPVLRLTDKAEPVARAVFATNDALLTVSEWQFGHMKRGSIKFWDVNSGKVMRQITGPPDGVHYYLDLSRGGEHLLGYVGAEKRVEYFSKSVDQRFRIWELPSGKVVATSPDIARPNQSELPKLRLSPNGNNVIVYWPTSGAARVFGLAREAIN